MATNNQINTTDNSQAVVYFQDGTQHLVDPGEQFGFQLIEKGFCTISDCPVGSEGEDYNAFVEMMFKFWQKLWDEVRQEIEQAQVPVPTPYEGEA